MGTVAEWGPAAWKFLHAVTFAYPDVPTLAEQLAAEQLFTTCLRTLLPCQRCREHFDSELRAHPPDTRSRATLSAWLVDLHNRVNLRLGKPTVTYAQAEAAYSSQCARDCFQQAQSLETTPQGARGSSSRTTSMTTVQRQAIGVAIALSVVGACALLWIAWRRRLAAGQ